jgi:hypothetical protein
MIKIYKFCFFYLKLTAACQTKAKRMNKTGITGIKSIIGAKGAYASGSFATNIAKDVIIYFFFHLLNSEFFDCLNFFKHKNFSGKIYGNDYNLILFRYLNRVEIKIKGKLLTSFTFMQRLVANKLA